MNASRWYARSLAIAAVAGGTVSSATATFAAEPAAPVETPPPNVSPAPASPSPLPPAYEQMSAPSTSPSSPPQRAHADDMHYVPRPSAYEFEEAPKGPERAPKYALWVGASLSLLSYGGRLYTNEQNQDEQAGNFVTSGLATQVSVGARLAQHFVPYVFYEYGAVGAGHRFTGEDATAHTSFYGAGFRYIAGNVNVAGFVADVALGFRSMSVSSGGQTYIMSGFEPLRIALGAEVRFNRFFTISPMAFVSGGAMSSTDGNVKYSAAGSRDGLVQPTYNDGATIENSKAYTVIGIGCGAYFDLFGH